MSLTEKSMLLIMATQGCAPTRRKSFSWPSDAAACEQANQLIRQTSYSTAIARSSIVIYGRSAAPSRSNFAHFSSFGIEVIHGLPLGDDPLGINIPNNL